MLDACNQKACEHHEDAQYEESDLPITESEKRGLHLRWNLSGNDEAYSNTKKRSYIEKAEHSPPLVNRKRIRQERLRNGKYSTIGETDTGEASENSGVRGRKADSDAETAANEAFSNDNTLLFAMRDEAPKWAKQELRARESKTHQSQLGRRKCKDRLKTREKGWKRGENGPAQRIGEEKAPAPQCEIIGNM